MSLLNAMISNTAIANFVTACMLACKDLHVAITGAKTMITIKTRDQSNLKK